MRIVDMAHSAEILCCFGHTHNTKNMGEAERKERKQDSISGESTEILVCVFLNKSHTMPIYPILLSNHHRHIKHCHILQTYTHASGKGTR